jgi:hypothetical protein
MEATLEKILTHLTSSESYSIVLSSNKTDFHTRFNPAFVLGSGESGEYEAALIGLETYNSIPNIQSDTLVYSVDGGEFITMVIPTGSYEIESLSEYIYRELGGDKIKISANNSTLQCEIDISKGFVVDMTTSTIGRMLGFESFGKLTAGLHVGTRAIDILPVSTILVNCDLISGSYVNGSPVPTIYSFFPDVSPGYKVIESPAHPVYLPLNYRNISSIHVWLTDQDGNALNLRGEKLSIRLHIRSK